MKESLQSYRNRPTKIDEEVSVEDYNGHTDLEKDDPAKDGPEEDSSDDPRAIYHNQQLKPYQGPPVNGKWAEFVSRTKKMTRMHVVS